MKYKLVRFKDGLYGLRRFSLFYLEYVFLDLDSIYVEWGIFDLPFNDCKGTLDECKDKIEELNRPRVKPKRDYGRVI